MPECNLLRYHIASHYQVERRAMGHRRTQRRPCGSVVCGRLPSNSRSHQKTANMWPAFSDCLSLRAHHVKHGIEVSHVRFRLRRSAAASSIIARSHARCSARYNKRRRRGPEDARTRRRRRSMYVSLPMPLMMASTLGVRAQIPANREQRLHDNIGPMRAVRASCGSMAC